MGELRPYDVDEIEYFELTSGGEVIRIWFVLPEGVTCSLFCTRNFFRGTKLAGQLFASFGSSQKVTTFRGICKHQNSRPFILLK